MNTSSGNVKIVPVKEGDPKLTVDLENVVRESGTDAWLIQRS